MRVAIFFDGKNFHTGFKSSTAPGTRVDFPAMAAWLVQRAGGSTLWRAHYYTGVERGDAAESDAQVGLGKFLRVLECQPGFFVHRFPRKVEHRACPSCGASVKFTQEKEVDTTMVADMLRLAAVDGFDVLVLVSGDADLAPAVENVRSLGKKVFVATWGTAVIGGSHAAGCLRSSRPRRWCRQLHCDGPALAATGRGRRFPDGRRFCRDGDDDWI